MGRSTRLRLSVDTPRSSRRVWDLRFTSKGTKYYIFAVAWTYDPGPLAQDLTNLRFSCLKSGHDLQSFHACEDKQVNRNAVVHVLTNYNTWEYAAMVVEKAKVNPSIRALHRFYPQFALMVLRFVFRGRVQPGTNTVLTYTDTLPIQRKRRSIEKVIKMACRAELAKNVRFEIYHHRRESNCWIQVADYCAWATFRKWESGDARTYNQLKCRLAASEFEVTRRGGTRYY